jgi:hypothetical protein
MKFKKGDKVVCIDNIDTEKSLKIHDVYTIEDFHQFFNMDFISLNNIKYPIFTINKFILLEEFRRLKIEKIKNEIKKR